LSKEAIDFIRGFDVEEKPVGAICHGPWTLIDAGIATAKHLTSWPSLKRDLINAGAEWTDDEVVVDARLVTSRKPADLPAFNDALAKELMVAEGTDPGPTS
jgi:protease I